MDDAPMIRVRGLAVGFDGEPILRDLDFDVRRGEVFAILGGSGCGKSTLLRHLIGLDEPIAGSIEVEGHAGQRLRFDRPPPYGVMFQSGALFGSATLEENVSLPLQRWTDLPPAAVSAVARGRLRMVGLGGFENHLPAEVSGGMKKRAGIARALALEPRLLFLDEPSAGLDPVTAAGVDQLIATLRDRLGVTVVLVTHELPSIFAVVDRCIVLDRDAHRIVAAGDPRALRDAAEDPRVHDFFHRKGGVRVG
ncbi:MAG: ATP-binding cassette domain-containing protein [Planctomycetes bacterium]|nr:ATP-binding cassette domain-containing protein [Planctomycetota bacterium]